MPALALGQIHGPARRPVGAPAGLRATVGAGVEAQRGGNGHHARAGRLGLQLRGPEVLADEGRGGGAGGEHFMLGGRRQEAQVGRQPQHTGGAQRAQQAAAGLVARGAVGDDLGDHRVVVGADGLAAGQAVVDADAGAGRWLPQRHVAALRQKVGLRVLGVQAHLDCMALQRHLVLRQRQCFAARHGQLPGHQVLAGDAFGDRVLDLQPRVHFQEVEAAFAVEQKLDRAGAHVLHRLGRSHRRRAHACTQGGIDGRRGRFLEHLLVPALDRTVALAEVDDVAVPVGKHLHFDVPRFHHRALQDQLVRAEGVGGLGPRRGQCRGQVGQVGHQAHAAPAAAGRGLDHDGHADLARLGEQRLVGLVGALVAGHAGHASGQHQALGSGLVAHLLDGVRVGADEHQAGGLHRTRKGGVLRQEAVAGVDRVGAAGGGSAQHGVDAEVAFAHRRRADAQRLVGLLHMQRAGVGLAVHGHRAVAFGARGADDAAGDLAAVGDKHRAEGGAAHGRAAHHRLTSAPRRSCWAASCVPGLHGRWPA